MTTKQQEKLAKEILKARQAYNEGNPIISDDEYDLLMGRLEKLNKDHPALNRHETPIDTGDVTLPFALPSLAKVRPDSGAEEWLERNKYQCGLVVSCKLDGLAGLAEYNEGKLVGLYSSSDDGWTGKNIMHLAPYIKNLPLVIDGKRHTCVRLELVISKEDFESVRGEYKNARNLAAGIKNASKGIHKNAGILSAIGLSVLKPRIEPYAAFKRMKDMGFTVAKHVLYPRGVAASTLSNVLKKMRNEYEYEIDGLVVERNIRTNAPDGIPSHMVAFKDNLLLDSAEAEVLDVSWEVSRYGKLTPLVWVKPVELEGTTVQKATGHNAKFIKDNRIGKGAIVHLIKSGSIIPKIEGVIKQSTVSPFASLEKDSYYWGESGVDIFAKEKQPEEEMRRITHFFNVLGVDGLRIGTVRKVYNRGVTNERDILKMREQEWVAFVGVNGKGIYESMKERAKAMTAIDVAYASGVFGRGMGRTKLEKIYAYYGNKESFLKIPKKDLPDVPVKIMGKMTGHAFAEHYQDFVDYVKYLGIPLAEVEVEEVELESNAMEGFKVCFTGVRDKDLEHYIAANGGQVVNAVNKETTHLIVKELGSNSSKAKKAKELGISEWTVPAFKAKYCV